MKHSTIVALTVLGLCVVSIDAGAVETPQMKPGLWEIRMQHSSDGKGADKPTIVNQCKDASMIARGKQAAEDYAKKNCSKNETRREGSKWVSDTVCKVGGSTMSSHTVTNVSDNAYHTENTTTFDPPTPGHSRSSTTIDGKWLKTCTPD
jgi:hypothetical protein